ncbi:Chromosome segregation ATPase (plasmid) [Cupriavidus sp. U2]|uniref:ATPase n=1 Tax=Cupriavidus sp. U2 TaxID=2920269 RepID=UPI00129D776C|nr:ATPase [Cupriavidus sp. U2]KAI3593364.1 Chromosome segregation ATPase [Cupriavidus sp. U2]
MTTTDLTPNEDITVDPAASTASPAHPTTLGAMDSSGDVEHELNEMEASADALRNEGLISTADHEQRKAEVERTRKLFRELQPEQRQAIIRRRRELGMQILDRELAGAAVVPIALKLNHTRLRPLFEQWWPYMNRMSLNLQRFGQSTFTRSELSTLETYLERELAKLEDYVEEQLRVAKAYREQKEKEMRDNSDIVFVPTIQRPSLSLEVQAYSRFAVRALQVLIKFDQTMDQFDFMVWNGIRDQSDVNDEVTRFLRKFQPLGLRSYTTHLKLMTTVRGI